MKKYLYLVLIIGLLPKISNGQIIAQNIAQKDEHSTYYSTDSTTIAGIVLVEGNDIENSRFCQIKEGDKVIIYTPYEVKEYRFKNGRTYKSFPIKINDTISRYFLEKLVEGKTNLYYLRTKDGIRKYYLIEGDSTNLLELPLLKEEYRAIFDSVVKGCPQAARNIPFIKIQKYNLMRFIYDYNNCANRPFPRFKYGFSIGISATQISAVNKKSIYSIPNYNKDWTISIGAFMDIPIPFSNFSFHPEIYYRRNSISKSFVNVYASDDLVINYSSICFPLLFRYSILSKKISPYFQVGPIYSRAIRNKSTLFEYESVNNNIFIKIIDSPVLQTDMGGFSIGSGMMSKFGSKSAWFGEIRYSKFYNLGHGSKLLNLSEITLGIGLIF